MIIQNEYSLGQFVKDIAGGCLATFLAILTWYIIEQIKKKQEFNKIKKGFQKFYEKISKFDVTDNEKADLTKAEIIHLIIYDIGIRNLSKILKFQFYKKEYDESYGHVYIIENSLWKLNIQSGIGKNAFNITKYEGATYHFDTRPNQDVSVRNEFLNYIKEECKKAKIKL
ncbi:MAG: hypothetical protein ACTSQP_08190 [Promethearchaeota archaeon]